MLPDDSHQGTDRRMLELEMKKRISTIEDGAIYEPKVDIISSKNKPHRPLDLLEQDTLPDQRSEFMLGEAGFTY